MYKHKLSLFVWYVNATRSVTFCSNNGYEIHDKIGAVLFVIETISPPKLKFTSCYSKVYKFFKYFKRREKRFFYIKLNIFGWEDTSKFLSWKVISTWNITYIQNSQYKTCINIWPHKLNVKKLKS